MTPIIKKVHTDELEQLSDAVMAADHLGDVADHLIGHFVDQARRSGASWTDIGRSMGVTRRAAQKRFFPKGSAQGPSLDAGQGFSRFTPRARHVVIAAQNEAHEARNGEIGPGHLTLGLLAEPDAIAAKVILAQGVQLDAVHGAVVAVLPPTSADVPELMACDAAGKKALELALREALRLGHNYIGTEHILLALLELADGAGPMAGLGIEKAAAEADIAHAVAVAVAAHDQQ